MKLAKFEDLKWEYDEEANFHIGLHKNLPDNKNADIVYGKIDPHQSLKTHYHERPDNTGYICFYFFNGGNIRVALPDSTDEVINSNKPFHFTFEHMEKHGVENLANEPIIFEVLSAPKYIEGEETQV